MKTLLKIAEMIDHGPTWLKDAASHVAKDAGLKTDDLELHRHSHSEKAAVNGLDPKSRRALKYVSYRTQDRDDEIVIPKAISLDSFRRYAHCLVNHNYSLLPVGSDVEINADDYGIKALTEYADTGAGTLANIVWALVSQGHLKSSSIGFVPTAFTKPGARDWDHVANGLQSSWKEFDKSRAEKSISRIITGGVLLEHSDVSVPCNADAEMISVCKAMHIEGTVAKQLGWEMKDGILVNKAATDPVPCVCDECGFVADAVVGSKCPECKTGDMKAKGKEKAIEISDKSKKDDEKLAEEAAAKKKKEDEEKAAAEKEKGFHSHAVEKPNPHMPGGSFSACVLLMEDKGHDSESAKKICGALQADAGGKGLTEAETKAVREVIEKGDLPGHEFRGNQYSGGGGGQAEGKPEGTGAGDEPSKEAITMSQRAMNASARYQDPPGRARYGDDKRRAITAHENAAEAHSVAAQAAKDKGDADQFESHREAAAFHRETVQSYRRSRDIDLTDLPADVPPPEKDYMKKSRKALPLPCTCDECGAEDTCAPGSACQEPDCEGMMVADKRKKAVGIPCTCDECGAEASCAPGSACEKPDCTGKMLPKKAEKAVTEIKVVRPAPSVKVLFVPPSGSEIAQRVGEAVEKALSRRTGKIM